MTGDDLTRADRPVKSLQENYIEMVRAQQFDGTVICRLHQDLADLWRENAELREALASAQAHSRLALVHFGNGMIEILAASE
jgi:hypothetical protein